jgi:hypothetical protein
VLARLLVEDIAGETGVGLLEAGGVSACRSACAAEGSEEVAESATMREGARARIGIASDMNRSARRSFIPRIVSEDEPLSATIMQWTAFHAARSMACALERRDGPVCAGVQLR